MNTQIYLNGITLKQLAEELKPLLVDLIPAKKEEIKLESEFVTREEVCKMLSFNKTSLWKHTKSGRLKSYGIGNRVLYKRSEVLEAVKPINH